MKGHVKSGTQTSSIANSNIFVIVVNTSLLSLCPIPFALFPGSIPGVEKMAREEPFAYSRPEEKEELVAKILADRVFEEGADAFDDDNDDNDAAPADGAMERTIAKDDGGVCKKC